LENLLSSRIPSQIRFGGNKFTKTNIGSDDFVATTPPIVHHFALLASNNLTLMKLTYFGHSCFSLETGGKTIVFDPFIRGNELAAHIDFKSIKADYILVSHGHDDHTADLIDLAKQTQATVVANWEIHAWLHKQGITNTHPMNIGGKWNFDFGTIHMVFAAHSSSFADGTFAGTAAGFVIESEEKTIYYSGDTALTSDMKLLPMKFGLDAAIMPVGDNFTMDYKDACIASYFIECDNIIAMHFDTFVFIKIDHQEVISFFLEEGKKINIPKVGETTII
jgi:L-ascorbate metabolism protein UlaG (beta-lactamase superfamily)